MFDDTGYAAYQHAQLEAQAASADPHKLVLMLIDGFLDELARVEGHLQAGNFERKAVSINKCIEILSGLDASLDREQGGKVADDIHQLYDFCGRQLFKVSVSKNSAELGVIYKVMNDLKEGWQALAA